MQALVHASAVSEETSRFSRDDDEDDKRRALEFFAPVGSKVWVKIFEVKEEPDPKSGMMRVRVSASMRAVSQQDGSDLDPEGKMQMPGFDNARGGGDSDGRNRRGGRNRPVSPPGGGGPLSPNPPAVGAILKARVASATKFGAFVLLEGFSGKGLVHITQIAEGLDMARLKEATDEDKEAAVKEMLPVGSDLLVKITDVVAAREDEESGALLPAKVSCSAKVVDQATGRDLDPTGERAAGGKGGAKASTAAVGASAGAVARQGDAVEWGHLAAEKYKGASGRDYDLVQETPEEAAAAAAAAVAAEEAAQRAEEEEARAGGGEGTLPPPPATITSVEAALAVLEQLGGGGSGGKKKHKKGWGKKKKAARTSKKEKKKRRKEKKRESRRSRSSSSSSSESE